MKESDKNIFRMLKDRKEWKQRISEAGEIPGSARLKRMASINTRILYIEHILRERGYKIE